ncbi:MAG: hypoxanthine phosphoribosyltransferase [Acidobacteria bacterium]|nr:MAG: hypoxanthine phosphoribosyltransferase [Acidobacteriota bacterium]
MTTGLGTVLISEGEIRRRIAEIGRQISKDYAGRTVTLVGILKGSFMFLADVIRAISLETPVEVDFMSVSSYGDATTTSGTVHIEKDLGISIDGKDVIIVEDIVDTGLTLLHVYNILSARGARSLRVATLLEKPGKSRYDRPLDYVGFKIPNKFVVGFGLDYAQRYRNLPDIRVLDDEA